MHGTQIRHLPRWQAQRRHDENRVAVLTVLAFVYALSMAAAGVALFVAGGGA